jgi:hypothetical protein
MPGSTVIVVKRDAVMTDLLRRRQTCCLMMWEAITACGNDGLFLTACAFYV